MSTITAPVKIAMRSFDESCITIISPMQKKCVLGYLTQKKRANIKMEKTVCACIKCEDITSFLRSDGQGNICFRCGETGHVRSQCLTYKVRMCWHNIHMECKQQDCPFAHSREELRTPWKQRCIRVVKVNGELVRMGCNSDTHTFRRCPVHRDLVFL